MSIGKNIKTLREENDMTQKELAKIAGVTDKAVSMWEKDERVPRMGPLQKIADKFGIKISDILSVTCGQGVCSVSSVPLVKDLPLSSKDLVEKNAISFIPVPTKELLEKEGYVFYNITSERMFPLINKGDFVLIHLKNFIASGKIGIISIDGNPPIPARLLFTGDEVTLESANPEFKALTFPKTEFGRLRVLGEIKKLVRNF